LEQIKGYIYGTNPINMFLTLNHQSLDLYKISRSFVLECYKLTKHLPPDEKFGMITQIRRAALSVHLNIAEGASRKSEAERKRFYEKARGSIIEIDAALDIAKDLCYLQDYVLEDIGTIMVRCFQILSKLISG
jgi:four helix bundle protein